MPADLSHLESRVNSVGENIQSTIPVSSTSYDDEDLFAAVRRGDYDRAEHILTQNPNAVRAQDRTTARTVLHIATRIFKPDVPFVEKIVQLMTEQDLEIRDGEGWTAFNVAVRKDIEMVKCMVSKNKNILVIPAYNKIPITWAAQFEKWDVVRYLYAFTEVVQVLVPEKGRHGADLLYSSLYWKQFDIASDLIQRSPRLAITKTYAGVLPLTALTNSPFALPSGMRLKLWQLSIYKGIHIEPTHAINEPTHAINVQNIADVQGNQSDICRSVAGLLQGLFSIPLQLSGINDLYKMKFVHVQSVEILDRMGEVIKSMSYRDIYNSGVYHALYHAAEEGNSEIIICLCKENQEFLNMEMARKRGERKKTVFQIAVECRQENVYNLIYGLTYPDRIFMANKQDRGGNNMLHKAAMLSPAAKLNHISGAALQMQRELQWFKEVESLNQACAGILNKKSKTPHQLFIETHRGLKKEAEMWIKETSTSCSVVGALIITMMFATASTVPGGNKDDTGLPVLLDHNLFMVFMISAAVSLFSSTTSVLTFLGILTSRYAEDDFLKSLPTKMIIGLTTLFISIAAMMVSFCSALFLMVQSRPWIVKPVIILASVPVSLFVLMQFPLLVEITVSTYGRGIFNRNVKCWL